MVTPDFGGNPEVHGKFDFPASISAVISALNNINSSEELMGSAHPTYLNLGCNL